MRSDGASTFTQFRGGVSVKLMLTQDSHLRQLGALVSTAQSLLPSDVWIPCVQVDSDLYLLHTELDVACIENGESSLYYSFVKACK